MTQGSFASRSLGHLAGRWKWVLLLENRKSLMERLSMRALGRKFLNVSFGACHQCHPQLPES